MNIKLFYDESGNDLQEIMEENLIDFYHEFYEQETIQSIENKGLCGIIYSIENIYFTKLGG